MSCKFSLYRNLWHVQNITWGKHLFGRRICQENFHCLLVCITMNALYYPNRSPLDTPSIIHQNYPSRKPIPTGLRTLYCPMVYFISNDYILLTSFRVHFRYHTDIRRERIEGKKLGLHLTSNFVVVCIYIRFVCILICMYVLFPHWAILQVLSG